MENKIAVPTGMIAAALLAQDRAVHPFKPVDVIIEAALLWQRDNAPRPTAEFTEEFQQECWKNAPSLALRDFAHWFARRMYDAPDVPEEIKDLLYPEYDNSRLIEAFNRGRKAK